MVDKTLDQEASETDNILETETQQAFIDADDAHMLGLIALGDEKAFSLLYKKYSQSLYNYLLRLMHDQAGGEDILQEVFVVVWRDAHRFRGHAQVKTWLYRITHHRAMSWLRHNWQLSKYIDQNRLPTENDGDGGIKSGWEVEQTRNILDKLSPKHRAVLELAFVHHMTYQEISEVLGVPVGTVKSRMSYALRILSHLFREIDHSRRDSEVT